MVYVPAATKFVLSVGMVTGLYQRMPRRDLFRQSASFAAIGGIVGAIAELTQKFGLWWAGHFCETSPRGNLDLRRKLVAFGKDKGTFLFLAESMTESVKEHFARSLNSGLPCTPAG